MRCFFLFGLLNVVWSRPVPLYSQLNPRNLTQYTELDGVPASEVGSILSDRNGYIWVGTLNGLARYDGYEFKRFFNNPNDPGSIKGLQVWSLFEDRKGQIWAPTSPTNLNAYDPATRSFRTYEYKHLIEHPANVEIGITAICEDHQGRIYFGVSTNFGETIYSSILYLDEGTVDIQRFFVPDSVDSENVLNMTTDPEGNIWIITYSGLFKIDTLHRWNKLSDWNRIFASVGDSPVDLKYGKDGHLWVTSANQVLYKFDLNTGQYQSYIPGGPRSGRYRHPLALNPVGHVWIGTDRGLALFNTTTKSFERFNFEAGHPMDQALVRIITPDEFGNVWIGTQMHGLFKYEEKAIFKSFGYKTDQKDGLTSGWANTICEARDGNLYITTSGPTGSGGISIMDPGGRSILRSVPYDQLSTNGILSFMEYAPNEFYIGTWQGVHQFSPFNLPAKKLQFEGIPNQLKVQKMVEDKKGNLWFGTTYGLYRRSKGSSVFMKYDLSLMQGSNESSNEVTNMFESPFHGLWLLTNNGLFLYKYETNKIERHAYDRTKGDILITQDINSFYEDSSGLAWVGTWQGGLSRYDPNTKKIVTYTLDDGLPSMSIQGILADEKKGVLWLSTFEGLSRFDLKEKKIYNYSISDGIQGQLFADGAALKTSKDIFIFGGSNGITVFNPDQITESSFPPKVFLTDLKLFNQSILPGEHSILKKPIRETNEIILKSSENNITLEFASIHYSNPAKNRSVYRLVGYENEWREAGNQHLAFYPNLAPGLYTFRVKAANNNGVWNEEGASLKITILPPWWRTTWAYLGYFILLITGGFAIDRYLRHRIVEKERERFQAKQLEQAKEIEQAYQDLGQAHETLKATQAQLIQSEKMASLGELTAGIAHEIQNPLNFVNNFSDVNKELIEELKEERLKAKGERRENLEDELLNNIEENELKINHHGKRADAIVKNMLQHSRNTSGQKETTDLNALCDEYLRLAYHGLKAKDKTYHAEFSFDPDPNLPKVAIVPQEVGRVLLNLINNAFYAVGERSLRVKDPERSLRVKDPERSLGVKDPERSLMAESPGATTKSESLSREEGYKPAVKVSTKWIKARLGNLAEIRIEDNGLGIPVEIREKIFQPFYTTKPTGEGTGLGLSLAYDIVKAHGGEILVRSRESGGSAFIIQLPVL